MTTGSTDNPAWTKAWTDVQTLRPIIEAHRDEAEEIRRLPDPVAAAFLERDVYRITLPEDLGGLGISPPQHFDLIVEVARSDASAAWLYWLGGVGLQFPGRAPPEVQAEVISTPAVGQASGLAPTGRALAVEGGYRVTGRWAWASGIHSAAYTSMNCLVYDGDTLRTNPDGSPVIMMAIVPSREVRILDTWHTGGMRGTGSTDFEMDGHFVADAWTLDFAGHAGRDTLPHPILKLTPYFFAYGVAAVAIGVARTTIEALMQLARTKQQPPKGLLAEQASIQFAVAKAQAMADAVEASMHAVLNRIWEAVCTRGSYEQEDRLRLRRAATHAVDECIGAVGMCYRAAGGSAVHRAQPFERALRDIHALAAHVAVQRGSMEQAGAIALGVADLTPMF